MGKDQPPSHQPPDPTGPPSQPLETQLAHLARDLLGCSSVQATLNQIVAAAIELVDGCTDAGIMVVHHGQGHPLVTSSPLADQIDRLQGELREGPCFEAARDGRPVLKVTDLTRASTRWPRFVPLAHQLGLGSMMAFLLFTDDPDEPGPPNLGSLNLYARRPGALTQRSEHIGWLMASHASVALAAARSTETLHAALSSRQFIGQAVGILMERHRLTDDQAFALLSRTSQNSNTKLHRVAEHLITTGELLGQH